ncbi:MAG: amidohydrolase family protein, partial [Candidatus Kapaibacteriota bacterium]
YQMAEKRLGKRTHFAYPWMSFIKNDVNLCSGSDFPIENPNPILGIYSLVNRENNDPKKIFGNETVGIEDAIRSYTINPSISIKEKPDGIKVGNSANLVILDKNPFQIEKEQIKEVKVLSTICQGKFIFQQ